MKQDPKLEQLIDKVNYEDELCKDAEARYMSYPEGSEKANRWYNDMNYHYQEREKAESKLMEYRKEHPEVDAFQEEEVDSDLEK